MPASQRAVWMISLKTMAYLVSKLGNPQRTTAHAVGNDVASQQSRVDPPGRERPGTRSLDEEQDGLSFSPGEMPSGLHVLGPKPNADHARGNAAQKRPSAHQP